MSRDELGEKERIAIHEAMKTTLYWWCRMYRKGSNMEETDITDIPEEMLAQFSGQERYCLDMVLETVMRSLDKISLDETNRIIDLCEWEYSPVIDTDESEEEQS